MNRWAGGAAVALVVVLWLPHVAAFPIHAELIVRGPTLLPAPSQMDGVPAGVLLRDTQAITELSLDAARIDVMKFTGSAAAAPGFLGTIRSPPDSVRWTATRVSLVPLSTGERQGFVGVVPDAGASMSLSAAGATVWEARDQSELGTGQGASGASWPEFVHQVSRPHLMASMPGVVEIRGSGTLKVMGPTLRVGIAENETVHETGARESSEFTRREVWMYLEFEDGVLRIATSMPMDVAAKTLERAAWDGTAAFTPVSGAFDLGGRRYQADGRRLSVTGDLVGSVMPLPGRDAVLTLQGQVRSTSLAQAPMASVNAPEQDVARGILGAFLLVAILSSGATIGAATWAHRSRRSRNARLEDCLANARAADRAREPALALASLAQARRLAPHDAGILMDEAWHLAAVGAIEDALSTYQDAARLLPSDDGSANLAAAVLHFERRNDPEAAAREIAMALRRDPALLIDVEGEVELYRALQGRALFDAAITRATLAMEERAA